MMSDSEFDALEEQLRTAEPEHPYFRIVGKLDEGSQLDKVEHSYPMLSMNKGKSVEDILAWSQKIEQRLEKEGFGEEAVSYIAEPKIDGISVSLEYDHGALLRASTRGDGKIGEDISRIIPFCPSFPKVLSYQQPLTVRGELYIPKKLANSEDGPLRNTIAGLVRRQEFDQRLIKVRAVFYQIFGSQSFESESQKVSQLKEWGFDVVFTQPLSPLQKQLGPFFERYKETLREELPYETDGIIIGVDKVSLHDLLDSFWQVSHHHHFNIALKPKAEGALTKLKEILWNISRQGDLTPVARFEPIELLGAVIEQASLYNFEHAKELGLCPGDMIYVERSNDVIPKVTQNYSATGREEHLFVTPERCPSCKGPLELVSVNLHCASPSCPEQQVQRILYFAKTLEIDGLGEGSVRALIKAGLLTGRASLFTLKAEDLEKVPLFGEKKSVSLISQIETARSASFFHFLAALGIPMVAMKSLENGKVPITDWAGLLSFSDESSAAARSICTWVKDPRSQALVRDLAQRTTPQRREVQVATLSVALTGQGPLPRGELAKRLAEKGIAVSGAVTKKVSALLSSEEQPTGSKADRARALGIDIVRYEEFLREKGIEIG